VLSTPTTFGTALIYLRTLIKDGFKDQVLDLPVGKSSLMFRPFTQMEQN
jgi:hypothetical protein